MPPPIVPEPTTAARFTGDYRSFLGNVGNLSHLALSKENMDERFRLIGEKAFGEKFLLSLAAFFERHSGRRLYRVNRCERSFHSPLFLADGIARCRENCGIVRGGSQLCCSFPRLGDWLIGDSAGESHGSGEKVSVDQTIDESQRGSVAGGHRLTLGTHLHCLGHADEPGQTLRSRGPGNNSQLHFRLADLRRG